MSTDEHDIKKRLNDILNRTDATQTLFKLLESELKGQQKNTDELQKVLDLLTPFIKDNPQWDPIMNLAQSLIYMYNSNNDRFQLIYHILEILVLKSHTQQPVLDSKLEYNPQSRLTEKDRESLDWLQQYFKHIKGEDSEQ